MGIKNSIPRLDAVDKVTGAAKYTEDLIPINALVGKTLHSTIANGTVRAIDVDEAWKIPGVVDILTCFDVPDWEYATCGHLACLLGRCSEFDNRPGSSNCSGSPSPVSRPKLSLSSFDEQDSRCAGQSGMRCPVPAGGTSPPALWGRTPHPTGRAGTARIGQVRPFPVPRRLG